MRPENWCATGRHPNMPKTSRNSSRIITTRSFRSGGPTCKMHCDCPEKVSLKNLRKYGFKKVLVTKNKGHLPQNFLISSIEFKSIPVQQKDGHLREASLLQFMYKNYYFLVIVRNPKYPHNEILSEQCLEFQGNRLLYQKMYNVYLA